MKNETLILQSGVFSNIKRLDIICRHRRDFYCSEIYTESFSIVPQIIRTVTISQKIYILLEIMQLAQYFTIMQENP